MRTILQKLKKKLLKLISKQENFLGTVLLKREQDTVYMTSVALRMKEGNRDNTKGTGSNKRINKIALRSSQQRNSFSSFSRP